MKKYIVLSLLIMIFQQSTSLIASTQSSFLQKELIFSSSAIIAEKENFIQIRSPFQ